MKAKLGLISAGARLAVVAALLIGMASPPPKKLDRSEDVERTAAQIPILPGKQLGNLSFACGKRRRETCTLDEFLVEAKVCALWVIRQGKLRLQRYGRPELCFDKEKSKQANGSDKEYGLASVTKSVASMLLGAAISKRYGAVTRADFDARLAEPVDKFVPNLAVSGYAGVPLRWVLDMRSGIRWREYGWHGWFENWTDVAKLGRVVKDQHKKSIVAFAKDYRGSGGGGERPAFNYSGLDASVMAVVVKEIADVKLVTKFMQDEIWRHIGPIASARWRVDVKRVPMGECCLNMTVGDLARLGLLALHRGKGPGGREIIPTAWFDLTTRSRPGDADRIEAGNISRNDDCELGYNAFWWLRRGKTDFTGIGINGQFLHVYPDKDAVVVQISDWGNWQDGDRLECLSLDAHDALVEASAQ